MSLTFPALTVVAAEAAAPASVTSIRDAVREHHAFVWRSVRRLGVPETDVEDAVQRVFLVLAKNVARVDRSKLRSYLFGVAMRVAANERRAARSRIQGSGDADRTPSLAAPADEALDARRARALLDEILDLLGDELRSVLVLHEFEHLTVPEIADLVGIPTGTVASRLRRARAELERHATRLRAKLRGGR